MSLTALQKQQYLDDMGITPWYPRMALPNALEAAVHATQEDPSISAAFPAETVKPSVQSNASEGEPNVVPLQQAKATPAHVVSEASSSASPENVNTRPVRFGLALYVMGDWLITSSLISTYQQANDADVRLIQAILRAVDGTETPVSYHHVISWPFFTNAQASQGMDAAKQYVNGVIEHLTEEHSVTKLLSFGGVLAKLNGWDSAEGQEYSLPRLNLPSVYKMLAQPALKATAWQQIQQSQLFKQQ